MQDHCIPAVTGEITEGQTDRALISIPICFHRKSNSAVHANAWSCSSFLLTVCDYSEENPPTISVVQFCNIDDAADVDLEKVTLLNVVQLSGHVS